MNFQSTIRTFQSLRGAEFNFSKTDSQVSVQLNRVVYISNQRANPRSVAPNS